MIASARTPVLDIRSYQRQVRPGVGPNLPQEAPAAVVDADLELVA